MARLGRVGRVVAGVVLATAAGDMGRAEPVSVSPARGGAMVVPVRLDPARLHVGGASAIVLPRILAAAARRLDRPSCHAVLADFADAPTFRPVERLSALGLTPAQYLGVLVFADGRDLPLCRSGHAAALTSPGSRVIFVCPTRFGEVALQDPERAEALLIHEALHSLGLPENPPGSDEITRRVRARCDDPGR